MEIVYLETSFVSLLVANPSRDLVTAGHQQVTRDWWRLRRAQFVCVASTEVVREAKQGDPEEVRKRLEVLSGLRALDLSTEAQRLMKGLLAARVLPPRAQTDAAHLAIAAAFKADYLLTWNCRHLANAQMLRPLEAKAKALGCQLPRVCTPSQLMGDLS